MSVPDTTALRLADVAAAVGGSVTGDPEVVVSGFASLDRAGASDLRVTERHDDEVAAWAGVRAGL